jgi:hypothetical protein
MRFAPFLVAAILAVPAVAQNHVEHQAPVAMPSEMEAMMAAFQAAMTPGEQHAHLAASAGSWAIEATMWMGEGAEPTVSKSTSERRSILGGRAVEEIFSGEFMGQRFEGRAHSGYDNVTKRWWSTWIDSMSTALTVMYSDSTSLTAQTFTGSSIDPATGEELRMRIEAVTESADREVHTFYETKGATPERKSMVLVYTRIK